jgi:hypothetical protein
VDPRDKYCVRSVSLDKIVLIYLFKINTSFFYIKLYILFYQYIYILIIVLMDLTTSFLDKENILSVT